MKQEFPPVQYFRKKQKQDLARARKRTGGTDGVMQYPILDTPLFGYEKVLLEGKSIMGLVESAHKRHPEIPVAVLDYGCGHNVALRGLIRGNFSGIDIEATGMSSGDPRTEEEKSFDEEKRIAFIDQDKAAFSLPEDSYDIILSKTTFIHLPNPLQVMKKLYRALRKDGVMYIEYEVSTSLALKVYSTEGHVKDIEFANQIIDDLKASGIDISNNGETLVIRKNDVEMKFPNVLPSDKYPGKYSYRDSTGT